MWFFFSSSCIWFFYLFFGGGVLFQIWPILITLVIHLTPSFILEIYWTQILYSVSDHYFICGLWGVWFCFVTVLVLPIFANGGLKFSNTWRVRLFYSDHWGISLLFFQHSYSLLHVFFFIILNIFSGISGWFLWSPSELYC